MHRPAFFLVAISLSLSSLAKAADKCPNLAGTYSGTDIKKVEFTTTVEQKDCESLTVTDSRSKEKITYTLDGKVAKDPQHIKDKNASHVRAFVAGDFVVLEKYNEKETVAKNGDKEEKTTTLEKLATLIMSVKKDGDVRVLSSTIFMHSLERDKAPFALSMDIKEKK